jgi:hypothetical protein
VVVVVAIVAGIAVAVGGSGGGDYKLTAPATLLSGQYKRTGEPTTKSGHGDGVTDGTSVTAQYQGSKQGFSLGGAYGKVDADKAMSAMLTALSVTDAVSESPAGLDGAQMKCASKDLSAGLKSPVCIWSDSSTATAVIWTPSTSAASLGDLKAPSLSDWAAFTVKVRNEVRVKK